MLLSLLILIIGLALITIAADQFVDGSATIAYRHHFSPLIVGLTLVAFGTSAPEIAITITSALKQKSAIALGNAIGSNLANICIVLGLSLLFFPVKWPKIGLIKLGYLLFASIITLYLLHDHYFSNTDGIILFLLLAVFMVYLYVRYQRFGEKKLQTLTYPTEHIKSYPLLRLIFGAILLPLSAILIIKQASIIARMVGVSEITIGLTIVAVGTSLPELIVSLSSFYKGHHQMAIGNIIGSNIFNLIAVLPFIGLFDPHHIDAKLVNRDIPIMLLTTLPLFALSYLPRLYLRICGLVFIMTFILYTWVLFQN